MPVTLPPIKSKNNDTSKRSGAQLQQLVGQSPVVPSSCSATVSATHLIQPNKDGSEIISSEALQKSPLVSHQGTDQLDEDLDLLLKLDAPVDYETSSVMEAMSHAEELEEDLKMSHEENETDAHPIIVMQCARKSEKTLRGNLKVAMLIK
ncbi:UNVERIFIED_CONTAM: hypothetical protein K2H54_047620 [Gekko kuhli]